MSKRMPRVTPWWSMEEWSEVHAMLYSPNSLDQQAGVHRVKAWLSRGRVPHAVDATSMLVEVGLQDMPSRYSTCSERERAHLLAMALVRFVNGIVDAGQRYLFSPFHPRQLMRRFGRGAIAASALSVAQNIGLPLWLVELRHQATHDKLPSLSYLRQGRSQALAWLNEHYWQIQARVVIDTTTALEELLDAYMANRKLAISSANDPSLGVDLQRLMEELVGLCNLDTYPELLLPLLLRQGRMLPAAGR